MSNSLGKLFIVAGIVITLLGLIIYFFGGRLNFLGKLPGDIRVERENFSFYFPFTSCILISLVITVVVKILRWIF
jgi:hypothetical protein